MVGVYLSTTEKCHYSSAGLKLLNEMRNEKVKTVYHTGLTLLLSANVPSCGRHPLHVPSSVSSVPSGAILFTSCIYVLYLFVAWSYAHSLGLFVCQFKMMP